MYVWNFKLLLLCAGSMVTAGLVKLVSGLFGLVKKPKKDSKADEQDSNSG